MPYLSGGKFDDPRPEIKRLRRATLKRACREAGLEFDENGMGADELRRLVSSNNLDMTPYMGEQHKLGPREAASKAMERNEKAMDAQAGEIAALKEQVAQLIELQMANASKDAEAPTEKTPIWRLRQLCKAADIPTARTDKAVDLVAKLNEHTA